MTSVSYPNAMTAYYTHNQAGEATGIEYKKTAHCAKTCPEVWCSDTIVPSIHGETLEQSSTLSEEPSYTYDAAGRLTQAQEIPAGEGCKTRIYNYDEDGNRTTETTREPGTEGKCASEGGSTEWHTYDTADGLADPGVTYETFGNTTKLPAVDAGGKEPSESLTSEYYVDSQVFKQEQGEQKIEYKLDPEERTLETISTGKPVDSTVISHYDASGSAIAWTGEGSGEKEKWTRNIPGIDGALTATQKGEGKTGGAVVLLLHDLKGDVVAEAALSETETKLLKSYNSTEFGVPNGKEAPPKYAWLGAGGVAGELPSGVITQDGVTYVPQTGRALQTEGVPLPAPQNAAKPFVRTITPWAAAVAAAEGAHQIALGEEESRKREEANKPPGLTPFPEEGEEVSDGGGEVSRCSGTSACAASIHHHIKCTLKSAVGINNGWVYAKGWANCSSTLPQFSTLQVCVYDVFVGHAPCDKQGSGFDANDPGSENVEPMRADLYAHAHTECYGGEVYRAWLWFWQPGWGSGVVRETPPDQQVECEEEGGMEVAEFFIEFLAPGPQ
jgi:hypothetical protein